MRRRALRRGIALVAAGGIGATAIGASPQPEGDAASPPATPPTPAPAAPQVRLRPENLAAKVPTPAEALKLFGAVQDFLIAGAPAGDVPAGGEAWRGVSGVCLTLLLDGRVLARSTVMEKSDAALAPDAAARAQLGADAARMAWGELREKFPPASTADTPEARRVILSSLVLSVELAGELTPLLIDDVAEANLEVPPGLAGVGANLGAGGGSAWMFPVQQLSMGWTPADALSASISRATGDAALAVTPARLLRTERGVTLVKFPVVHAARINAGSAGAPTLLYRGHEPIDASWLTYGQLVQSAGRLAQHLRARMDAKPRPVLGVYSPVSAMSTPATDPDLALAMTLAALLDHAIVTRADPRELVDHWRDSRGRAKSMSLVARAASVIAGERAMAAARDAGTAQDVREKIATLAEGLGPAFDTAAGFGQDVPAGARGMVACALVRAAQASAPGAVRDELSVRANAAVQRVLLDTPGGELVSHMPWLGWAAQGLADLAGEKEIPSAPALRTMRDRVWEHQLTPTDAGADGLDLVGGIVFTKGSAMLPTAATARPLAFLAGALTDERLTTPEERGTQLARVIGTLRFLRQLQADESSAWMYPDRTAAIGGVRAAPWDQKMSADSSVYTLLAYSRAIAAIDAQVRANSGGPAPARPDGQTPGK